MKKGLVVALTALILGLVLVFFNENPFFKLKDNICNIINSATIRKSYVVVESSTKVPATKEVFATKIENSKPAVEEKNNININEAQNSSLNVNNTKTSEYAYYKEYSFNNIKELDIDLYGVDVTLEENLENDVKVKVLLKEYQKNEVDNLLPTISQEQGTLKITQQNFKVYKSKLINIDKDNMYHIVVSLPKNIIQNIDIDMCASLINIKNIHSINTKLEIAAVTMSIDKLNSQNADFEIVAAETVLNNSNINNLKVENSTASFKVKNSNIHNFDLENSAAQFETYNSFLGNSNIQISMGDLKLINTTIKNSDIELSMARLRSKNLIFEGQNFISSSMSSVDISLSDKNKAQVINSKKDILNFSDFLYIHGNFTTSASVY